MKVYKITDKDNYTQRGEEGETLWGENVTHKAEGRGELCPKGVIRCYRDPYLAVFMSPIYDKCNPMKLWEAETPMIIYDDGTISDVRELATIKEIPPPELDILQRIKIAILCAREVCVDDRFDSWAMKWFWGMEKGARNSAPAWDAAIDAKTTNPIAWRVAGAAALLGTLYDNSAAKDANRGAAWNTTGWQSRVAILAAEGVVLAGIADVAENDTLDIINSIVELDIKRKSRISNRKEEVEESISLETRLEWERDLLKPISCQLSPNVETKPSILRILENAPYNRRAVPFNEIVKQVSENLKQENNFTRNAIKELRAAGKVTVFRAQDSNAKVVKLV